MPQVRQTHKDGERGGNGPTGTIFYEQQASMSLVTFQAMQLKPCTAEGHLVYHSHSWHTLLVLVLTLPRLQHPFL